MKLFKVAKAWQFSNIWCGDNGKPSGRRATALLFSVHLLYNLNKITKVLGSILGLIENGKTLDPLILSSYSTILAQVGIMVIAEVGVVTAFWGMTTAQSMQAAKLNAPAQPAGTIVSAPNSQVQVNPDPNQQPTTT